MKFEKGDKVISIVCNRIFGTIKKYINEKDFIFEYNNKEIIGNENYYKKSR